MNISVLPVHVARPLFKLYTTEVDFKRLHLISDILLGFFRLYGHAIIKMSEKECLISEANEQVIETLMEKDSHGLWSTTIAKLLQEHAKKDSSNIPNAFFLMFGIATKPSEQRNIKRMSVKHTVIDSKGKKQLIETSNIPIELLINFRNKYVGHGTVYSEDESKEIFQTYEPILQAFVDGLLSCTGFQFVDSQTGASIQGYEQPCSGSIRLNLDESEYEFESTGQLALDSWASELNTSVGKSLSYDSNDQRIIGAYPYFIAHPYKRALDEADDFKRLHLLKEILLNYLKYMGLLTASEYFNSNLKIGDINRAFKNFLYRPQFGHWNAFMRNAITALNKNNHSWFVKELPDYYDRVEIMPYAEQGDTAIGKLIRFRNHYLGHGIVPSDKKARLLWDEHFQLLKSLLLEMDFCRNYTIVSSDKTISWRLMGDEITQVNLRQKLKSNVAILNAQNEELSIIPFFILPGEYFIKEVSQRAKLMVYEQNTGSRIVFFSPESVHGETNNEHVLEQLNLMIREKEKREPIRFNDLNLESWKGLLKENNESTIQSLVAEKKVIKGIYQERQEAEIALRSWVGARAGLFFLSAEAGSGKTNLLVEMNRQYFEQGLDTILLRGNRFRTPDIWEEICYRLNLTADSSIEDTSFVKYEQENPLIILIDGANENANSTALFESIIQFLRKHKGGHIKIVLSWRVNTKSELPQADEQYEPIIYSDAKENSREENLIARSCYWFKPLNKVEVEGAWNKYINDKQDKIRRKPNFSYEELTYHDRSLSDQLDNPLLLRLFLELNNGKGLPKNRGGFISIWTLYHEKLIAQ